MDSLDQLLNMGAQNYASSPASTYTPSAGLSPAAIDQPVSLANQPVAGLSQQQPQQQQQQQSTWDSLFHGGGSSKFTPQELRDYTSISNAIAHEEDPEVLSQLRGQRDELLKGTGDRGGVFGSIGRALTGQGQTGGEKLGSYLAMFGLPIVKAYLNRMAAQQMNDAVNSNYNTLSGQMLANSRNTLNRG